MERLTHNYLHCPILPSEANREAVKWYRKAAEQGDAEAQFNLGAMYYQGHGVPEDYPEAVKWYRAAAEKGVDKAQAVLGLMYYFGRGVPEDYVKAYAWMNLAAAQGDEDAVKSKAQIREKMTRAQVSEGQKLAGDLFKRIESARLD